MSRSIEPIGTGFESNYSLNSKVSAANSGISSSVGMLTKLGLTCKESANTTPPQSPSFEDT